MKKSLYRLFKICLAGTLGIVAILARLLYACIRSIRFMRTHLFVMAAAIGAVCLGLVITAYLMLAPAGKDGTVEIPRGATLQRTANKLAHNGIIRSKALFVVWMKLSGREKKIEAGTHHFHAQDNLFDVSRILLSARAQEVQITITEGLTMHQTAAVIHDTLGIDTSAFLSLCKNDSLASCINREARTLEGYLFPDTYRFTKDASARDVITKMTARFVQMYDRLRPRTAIDSTFSQHEIVTMASIVEKEATVDSERARIAGVFYNRLRLGYPLGADPTVRYAIKKFTGPLRVSELNVNSPYNTRRFKGLPPGPICSPGFASLQAAVSPEDTDYLYFVAKWDGSGTHVFSKTHTGHIRNKMKIRRERNIWDDKN
jgi:UPF0755 protein